MTELTRRYIVMRMATEGPFDARDQDAVFVLKPWKDPAALRALETYRDHCYLDLAREITAWIDVIAAGPTVRGEVGERNEKHLATAAAGAVRPERAAMRRAKARLRPAARESQRAPARRKSPKRKGRP
jgi:hypothetical protein